VNITTEAMQTGSQISYSWFAQNILECGDCNEVSIQAFSNETVTVVVEDENGCSDEAKINVIVKDLPDVWLPNIFSRTDANPINHEVFLYTAPFVKSVKDFLIFDRWGNMLFEKSNVDPKFETITWSGVHNGKPLDSGVYMMVVNYELESGKQFSIRQSVNLIK